MNKNIFILLFFSVLMFSCNSPKNEESKPQNEPAVFETPDALEESKISYSRGAYRNLINELYSEIEGENPRLQELNEYWEKLEDKKNDQIVKYNSYKEKSGSYYNEAFAELNRMDDSVFMKEIEELVLTSQQKFDSQIKHLDNLKIKIEQAELSANDKKTALKILLTLPLIESYQKEKMPSKERFEMTLQEYEQFKLKVDTLTPS